MSSKRLNTEVAKPRCCGHAGRVTLPILPDLVGTRVPARLRWQGFASKVNERYHVTYRKVASYQDLLARVNSDD